MTQTLLAYLLTTVAAVWVIWSMLLPKTLKRRIKAPFAGRKAVPAGKSGGCGDGCGCGD